MRGTLLVLLLAFVGLSAAAVREHFIAADEVEWDYAPTGTNLVSGLPIAEDPKSAFYFAQDTLRIGGTYIKAIYREYTDASFSRLADRPDEWEHLGIMGPPLYAEVGDTLRVHFRNNARYNFSMNAVGLSYNKDNEGSNYPYDGPAGDGDFVRPGDEYTYTWDVPATSGPAEGDWSSVVTMYTSNVNRIADQFSGLIGPIVVTAKGMADSSGRPQDVDREFFLALTAFSETESPYAVDNIIEYLGVDPGEAFADPGFFPSNLMHGINGMLYNNLPGLTMNAYEHVRWYVFSQGNVFDIHTPNWNGQTLLDRGQHRVATTYVFPGTTEVLEMVPDRAGEWQLHCSVNFHIDGGQQALYEVRDVSSRGQNYATTDDIASFLFRDPDTEPAESYNSSPDDSNPFSAASSLSASLALIVGIVCLVL